MRRIVGLTAAALVALASAGAARAQIIWDGGDDDWNSANWNEGMTAEEAFGRTNGLEIGGTELSDVVEIADGVVTYDPNANGDFRVRSGGPGEPGGTLNLTDATLTMDSSEAADGAWTQFDGAALNLNNSTFQRTKSGDSDSGGALIFGSWRSYDDQVINVNLTNGSVLDNDGQVWFGAWDDNAPGLTVNMTINDGHLDLRGGWTSEFLGPGDADLIFINDWNADAAAPKGEKYAINFTGPGSILVSEAGILNPIQTELLDYDFTEIDQVSYQQLWDRGILQAHGFSGAKGAKFDGFFSVNGEMGFDDYELVSNVVAPEPVVWDGGDGAWNSAGWNGGRTAQEVLGRTNGLEIGSNEIGWNIHIDDGAVAYNPNDNGDFRLRAGGSVNIGPNGSLSIDTASDVDGKWTEFDGDALNIDGGSFNRTKSLPSEGGGAMIFGSWRSYDDQKIEINITGGGEFNNDGQVWFGAWADNAPGLEVVMTINDGHVDLTGGDNYDLLTGDPPPVGPGNADLILLNGWNAETGEAKGENYVINFTGPGTFTVDHSGIMNPIATDDDSNPASYGDTITTLLSYEDLWDSGILQANGQSGLDGATFTDFFEIISGAVGEDDYTLMSLLGGSVDLPGDANRDGMVDLADFNILKGNFNTSGDDVAWEDGDFNNDMAVDLADFNILKANFNTSAEAVPEPATLALAGLAACGLAFLRRRR